MQQIFQVSVKMARPNQGVSLNDGGVLFQRRVPQKGFEVRGWGGEPVVTGKWKPCWRPSHWRLKSGRLKNSLRLAKTNPFGISV